jgi:hypothetical protein
MGAKAWVDPRSASAQKHPVTFMVCEGVGVRCSYYYYSLVECLPVPRASQTQTRPQRASGGEARGGRKTHTERKGQGIMLLMFYWGPCGLT